MQKKNSKFFIISILTLLIGLIVPISIGISLYKKLASPVTFYFNGQGSEVIEETNYYLVGSFNEWTTSNEYKLTLNTAASLGENQKAEYMLQNIPLNKDVVLKIRDDASSPHYCATYTHQWSDAVSLDGDGNYTVPMTSNTYSFYLKVYNDGSLKTHIEANKDVLFFKPNLSVDNSDNNWTSGNATFFAHFFGTNLDPAVDSQFVSAGSGYYKVNIPTNAEKVVIVRMPPSSTSINWDTKYNQSGDIVLANVDANNCITNYAWNDWTASSNSNWEAK